MRPIGTYDLVMTQRHLAAAGAGAVAMHREAALRRRSQLRPGWGAVGRVQALLGRAPVQRACCVG